MKKEGSATQNPSGSIPTRTDFVENEKKRGGGGRELLGEGTGQPWNCEKGEVELVRIRLASIGGVWSFTVLLFWGSLMFPHLWIVNFLKGSITHVMRSY